MKHLKSISLRRAAASILTASLCFFALDAQPPEHSQGCGGQNCIKVKVYDEDMVERQPSFPGGQCELTRFINKVRRYPLEAYSREIQGRVLVSFIVDTDGRIVNVHVVRGVEESLNREAVRVISEMPNWEPGCIDNQPVPVQCMLPIPFRR